MHLKLENHWFREQMCQHVITLSLVIKVKKVKKYCWGYCMIEVAQSKVRVLPPSMWHMKIT